MPADPKECNERKWHQHLVDLDGHPISTARKQYITWKRGTKLQKFFSCIEIYLPSGEVWQAPEIDCNHGLCHIHPNGHYPPSGKKENIIEIMHLSKQEDVAQARAAADAIIGLTALNICVSGGDWDEERIVKFAKSNTSDATRQLVDVRNGSER